MSSAEKCDGCGEDKIECRDFEGKLWHYSCYRKAHRPFDPPNKVDNRRDGY